MIRLIIGILLIGLFSFVLYSIPNHEKLNGAVGAAVTLLLPGVLLTYFGWQSTTWGRMRSFRSTDPKKRKRAFDQLVSSTNTDALIRLMSQKESTDVRETAASALTDIGKSAIEPVIHAALWNEMTTDEALKILRKVRSHELLHLLNEPLKMQNAKVQQNARTLMLAIAKEGVNSSSREDVEASLTALIGLNNAECIDAIVTVLKKRGSEEWHVKARTQAARALGDIGEAAVIQPLVYAFVLATGETNVAIQNELARFGSQIVEPILTSVFGGFLKPDKALKLLKRVNAIPQVLDRSLENLENSNAEAVLNLINPGWTKSPQAVAHVDRLIRNLHQGDANTRRNILSALGRIRDQRAVEPLIELLSDSEVGDAAASALGDIGAVEAIGALKAALEKKNTRLAAANSLRRIGGTEATSILEQHRSEIVSALAEDFWLEGGPIHWEEVCDRYEGFPRWKQFCELIEYRKMGAPEADAHVAKIVDLAAETLSAKEFEDWRSAGKLQAASEIMRLAGDMTSVDPLKQTLDALQNWLEEEKQAERHDDVERTRLLREAEADPDPLKGFQKTAALVNALSFRKEKEWGWAAPFRAAESSIKEAIKEITERHQRDRDAAKASVAALEQSALSLLEAGKAEEAESTARRLLEQRPDADTARAIWKKARKAQGKDLTLDMAEEKKKQIYSEYHGILDGEFLTQSHFAKDFQRAAEKASISEIGRILKEKSGAATSEARNAILQKYAIGEFDLDLILQQGKREAWPISKLGAKEAVGITAHERLRDSLRCQYCGKRNVASFWPQHGDWVPFYHQTSEKTRQQTGAFHLPILCPFCNKIWYVVWDQSPDPLAETFVHHIERMCNSFNHDPEKSKPFLDLLSERMMEDVFDTIRRTLERTVAKEIKTEHIFETDSYFLVLWIVPEVLLSLIRRHLPNGYFVEIDGAIQQWNRVSKPFVHWTYCWDGQQAALHLTFIPKKEDLSRVTSMFPVDLLSPEEKKAFGIISEDVK